LQGTTSAVPSPPQQNCTMMAGTVLPVLLAHRFKAPVACFLSGYSVAWSPVVLGQLLKSEAGRVAADHQPASDLQMDRQGMDSSCTCPVDAAIAAAVEFRTSTVWLPTLGLGPCFFFIRWSPLSSHLLTCNHSMALDGDLVSQMSGARYLSFCRRRRIQ
jgi:hypothetical protein